MDWYRDWRHEDRRRCMGPRVTEALVGFALFVAGCAGLGWMLWQALTLWQEVGGR